MVCSPFYKYEANESEVFNLHNENICGLSAACYCWYSLHVVRICAIYQNTQLNNVPLMFYCSKWLRTRVSNYFRRKSFPIDNQLRFFECSTMSAIPLAATPTTVAPTPIIPLPKRKSTMPIGKAK